MADKNSEMRRSAQKDSRRQDVGLPTWLKFYVYGLHGLLIEVTFTAAWEFVVNLDRKFPGCSSLWSFPIYASSGLVMEAMFHQMRYKVPFLMRGLVYLCWIYAWEFSTGFVLVHFSACPWDYSAFRYNVCGLITLEYAPLWFSVSLLMERVVIGKIASLRWAPETIKVSL